MKKLIYGLVAGLALVLCAPVAQAQIKIVKNAMGKNGLDVSGFRADGSPAAQTFQRTLQNDLFLSGWFVPAAAGGDVRLAGSVSGGVTAECTVTETATRRTYLSRSYTSSVGEARRLAHKAADEIIKAVTGKPGFFSGRMVLVGNLTGHKELYVCDADGQGMLQVTHDNSISILPKWSPDGKKIVYTSFYSRFPDLVMIDYSTGQRWRVANFPGLNTGGAISPDGRSIAMVLSKDGNPDLYVKDIASGMLARLTMTARAAEASPSWSPDGSQMVYVSDQSGSPQLYLISRGGGMPRRISRGVQSVAPEWGKNGLIAHASLMGGRFQICVLNPQTQENVQITPGDANYEDPTWMADGRHIACSRTVTGRSAIYLLDMKGDVPVSLISGKGNWCSPKMTQ